MSGIGAIVIMCVAIATAKLINSGPVIELLGDGIARYAGAQRFWLQFIATSVAYMLLQCAFAWTLFSDIKRVQRGLATWVISLYAVVCSLPGIALALSGMLALKQVRAQLVDQNSLVVALIALVILLGQVIGIGVTCLSRLSPTSIKRINQALVGIAVAYYAALFSSIYFVYISTWTYVGGFALALFFICVVVIIVDALFKWRWIMLGGLVAAYLFIPSIALSVSELAAKHEEQKYHLTGYFENKLYKLPKLEQAVDAWLQNFQDEVKSDKHGIPIFLVSAQGGGMYAAYHAALLLSRLNELSCGAFNRHIFSISTVSGGALGASVYSAMAKAQANSQGSSSCGTFPYRPVSDFFDADLLSPLIVSGLYVDLPLSVVGSSRFIFGRSARSVAFERTIVRRFEELGQLAAGNTFKGNFLDYWHPEDQTPALIFTATLVNNGTPIMISPFQDSFPLVYPQAFPRQTVGSNYWGWAWGETPASLVNMVSITSRYPFVSEPELIYWSAIGETSVRLKATDGGFVDNSGISATNQIVDVFQRVLKAKGLEDRFRLIAIVIGDAPDNTLSPAEFDPNELVAPFLTLYRARGFQAQRVLEELKRKGVEVVRNALTNGDKEFTLSWQQSRRSREIIAKTIDFTIGSREAVREVNFFFALENHAANCIVLRSLQVSCLTKEEIFERMWPRSKS
jgi:hypothetical protein